MEYPAETYFKLSRFTPNWLATSGVMNLCEEQKCYWFLDIIISYIPKILEKSPDYLIIFKITLNKKDPTSARFTASWADSPGERATVKIKQDIPFTDLAENLTVWAINESGTDKHNPKCNTILLLPEEY